jgi:threonine/homoserine/homoserine lactone efflux protein
VDHSAFNSYSPVLAFAAAAFLLNLSPGPSILYVTSRGIANGKLAGLLTAVGLATGSAFHALLAGIGVTGLLARSRYFVLAVGVCGGSYLLYLGWKALRDDDAFRFAEPGDGLRKSMSLRLFIQAVAVEFLNPKTALFYLSLVPGFIISQNYTTLQAVMFSLIVPATALPIDIIAGTTGGALARYFSNSDQATKMLSRVSALVLVTLGIWAICNALKY